MVAEARQVSSVGKEYKNCPGAAPRHKKTDVNNRSAPTRKSFLCRSGYQFACAAARGKKASNVEAERSELVDSALFVVHEGITRQGHRVRAPGS